MKFLILLFSLLLVSEMARTESSCTHLPTLPQHTLNVRQLGAVGDGKADDTAALQKALDKGGWILIPPGTYNYSKVLQVKTAGTNLWAQDGATLHATSAEAQSVHVTAANCGIFGLTLTSDVKKGRKSQLFHHRIVVESTSNTTLMGNKITSGAAAGIFIFKSKNFLIAKNFVGNTLADHIHVTGPSTDGRIIENTVDAPLTGDDSIAVVGYGTAPNKNILIQGNIIKSSAWGNGIDITGAQDVTVIDNKISNICVNAAISIKNEYVYNSSATNTNILVENNQITDHALRGCFGLGPNTNQPAILVFHQPPGYGRDILIKNNLIDRSSIAGIGIARPKLTAECQVGIQGNQIKNTKYPFAFLQKSTNDCPLICSENKSEDLVRNSAECPTGKMPTVTGSSLSCS